jgi:hypothetical protein
MRPPLRTSADRPVVLAQGGQCCREAQLSSCGPAPNPHAVVPFGTPYPLGLLSARGGGCRGPAPVPDAHGGVLLVTLPLESPSTPGCGAAAGRIAPAPAFGLVPGTRGPRRAHGVFDRTHGGRHAARARRSRSSCSSPSSRCAAHAGIGAQHPVGADALPRPPRKAALMPVYPALATRRRPGSSPWSASSAAAFRQPAHFWRW